MKRPDNGEVMTGSGYGSQLETVSDIPLSPGRHASAQRGGYFVRQISSNVPEPLLHISDLLFAPATLQEQCGNWGLDVLFRALIQAFDLDFIHVHVEDETQATCVEVTERAQSRADGSAGDVLLPLLGYFTPASAGEVAAFHDESERALKFQLAIGAMKGLLVIGSSRACFPSEVEQLALSFAARRVASDLREALCKGAKEESSSREKVAVHADATAVSADSPSGIQTLSGEDLTTSYGTGLVAGLPDHRLREMFDRIPMVAWSSFANGACEFLNKAHSEYTGLSAAQSRYWGWQTAIHPQDLGRRMELWGKSLATGQPSEAEVRIRRHDGVYRWFVLRIEPWRDNTGTIIRWYGAAADIEDRKHAEENWAASEARLSRLINTIPMLIWSSLPDGLAEFFNAQWYQYTAFTSDQSDGWGWTAALHRDDLRCATEYWRTIISADDHDECGFEARIRRHDGEYRWFWLRANAMRDEIGAVKRWYVIGTDVHDRKLAEDGIRRSEALLVEAQRLAGLGVFSWRVGSETISWCGQLYTMFGFEQGISITRSMIEQRIHPEDSPFIFDKVNLENGRGTSFDEQIRILMPDGSLRYLRYYAYATAALTGEVEYIGMIQDITEQHIASEELEEARAELGRAARASGLGVLTASVAHEVNQPLAGIVTNANTCLRMLNSDPPNIAGAIETARRTIRDGNRAADIVSRLRKLFNQKEVNASWLDLNAVVREVVELVQADLHRNRIALKDIYDPTLPQVLGDRIQLQQVVMNLIRNAVDAIKMAAKYPRVIVVRVSYREDYAQLSVKDTGVGFDNSVKEKMFDAFFTTKGDGMGIGLSVSRSILEAHRGKMWATNNEAQGATFGFSIPCQVPRYANDDQER
ncbi:PAS domain-containing sensor histidine kinase [Paraburkholderia sp. 32]|uniref:PAS domain-containing sensor histidine kinase n=1 Tax=Paraburkholderia sp. 32 TaxID=2991057 RepID=UPI003D1F95C4